MSTPNKKLSDEELQELRSVDFTTKTGVVLTSDVLDLQIGPEGSAERKEFEAKAYAWYYGEIFRDRRKELGMTQKQLAEKIGQERTYINQIEKGETDLQLSSFIRIASALDLQLRLEKEIE